MLLGVVVIMCISCLFVGLVVGGGGGGMGGSVLL